MTGGTAADRHGASLSSGGHVSNGVDLGLDQPGAGFPGAPGQANAASLQADALGTGNSHGPAALLTSSSEPNIQNSSGRAPPLPQTLAHARRVKTLALTGPELCALLLPKAACVARLAASLRLAVRNRRLVKAAVVAALRTWALLSRSRRLWSKVFSVALPRALLRRRRIDSVRVRVFSIGIMLRSVASARGAAASADAAAAKAATAKPLAVQPTKKVAAASETGPKLRPIHWDALTDAGIKGTIWDRGTELRSDALPDGGPGGAAESKTPAALLLPALVTKFAEKPPAPDKPRPVGAGAAESVASHQQLSCLLAIEVRRVACAFRTSWRRTGTTGAVAGKARHGSLYLHRKSRRQVPLGGDTQGAAGYGSRRARRRA